MSVTKFNKEEFLSLVINKLATEDGLKEIFYQKMLLGLHDNDPVYKTDTVEHTEGGVTVPSDVLSNILNNIDWEMFTSTEYGEDEFFNGPDGLYTPLCDALKEVFEAQGNDYKKMDLVGGDNSWWSNSYWNESVAKLMQILAQRIDPDNIKTYEQSGLLIELVEPPENDGMMDVDHLRGSIALKRGTYKGTIAELRIIDIMDADAGYSFAGENDTYWFGKYFDKVTYSYRSNPQSELKSVTYEKILYKQEALETLAAIENGYEIDVNNLRRLLYTNSETSLGSYIYSGERVSEHVPAVPFGGTIQVTMETEGEKHTFKVVKNPWVIPWYNIDGETYRRVRGADKKLSALTDPSKLDFTRLRKDQLESNDFLNTKAREVYDELDCYGEERRAADALKFSDGTQVNYKTDTKWGNIDMDNRQILKMEDGSVETVYAETCAFELNDYLPSPLPVGYEDLVDKSISFCYSHLELTDGIRPIEYDKTECESYLASLLSAVIATEPAANQICDLILQADKEDKSLIAMVEIVEDADDCKSVELGSMLHYIGKYGSVLIDEPYFEKLAGRYGFTLDEITYHFYFEIFIGPYIEQTSRWIRLIMPRYKRRVEVEDLNRNFWVIGQVLTGICIDIFDPNGPIGVMIKGLLNEIAQLWENVAFLWAALALLSQRRFYGKTYTEVVTVPNETFLPYLKYDNFNHMTTSTNMEIIKQKLNYLISQYPEKNLVILPQVRLQNYERNYYDVIWYPGVFVYDRNKDIGWEIYYFDPDEEEGIVVDLKDYVNYIYGLHEEEETYSYLAPLSDTENETADNDTRFYGMVRDNISIEGNLYTYDTVNNEWNEDRSINVSINFIDLAKYLVTQNKTPILQITSTLEENEMDIEIVYDIKDGGEIDKVEMTSVNIDRGYYQGEVLSTCMDVDVIEYEIHVETYSYQNMNPDDNQSKYEIVENPLIYKNKYWTNDKAELEAELNRIWTEREYTKKDILFVKAQRTYASGYSLPCGFGIMFFIKGVKQEYYYPLVTEQLGFDGIYWIRTREEDGHESSYGTNYSDNEFIILRKNEDDKLTPTNWSIMFISCYGGSHVPMFSDIDSPAYNGSVRALDAINAMPSDVHDWERDDNVIRWSDMHGTQPAIQQETDIQNDADYQGDIREIYEFLNGTEFVNPDGYYVDGGIFTGQTILAFGPGENQWGSQTYKRISPSEWQPDALTWTKDATLNGSEKGFNDLRNNYIAFMNLNIRGKKYTEGYERNYDRYKDNGRAKIQNGDSLTDWQAYTWEDET